MVRQWQTLFFGKRYSNTVLGRKTNFPLLAEAFGAESYHVETAEELENAMAEAMKCEGPVLVEVMIEKDEYVLPMLPPGGVIENIITTKKQEKK